MLELMLDLFGAKDLIDLEAVMKLLLRLTVNLVTTTIIVRGIYVRLHKWNEHVFTYFAFNLITFLLCLLLRKVPIELGFALGLFAVFGILRYRTEPIRIRDLTYLFVVIGVAILNALSNKSISVAEVVLTNSLIVAITGVLEFGGAQYLLATATVDYDNPAMLLPQNREALLQDLRNRTGLDVRDVKVRSVDLIRDTAKLEVHYRD